MVGSSLLTILITLLFADPGLLSEEDVLELPDFTLLGPILGPYTTESNSSIVKSVLTHEHFDKMNMTIVIELG